jgi:hypothetical protein
MLDCDWSSDVCSSDLAFAASATRVQQVNGVVAVALLALAGHLLFLGFRALLPGQTLGQGASAT